MHDVSKLGLHEDPILTLDSYSGLLEVSKVSGEQVLMRYRPNMAVLRVFLSWNHSVTAEKTGKQMYEKWIGQF